MVQFTSIQATMYQFHGGYACYVPYCRFSSCSRAVDEDGYLSVFERTLDIRVSYRIVRASLWRRQVPSGGSLADMINCRSYIVAKSIIISAAQSSWRWYFSPSSVSQPSPNDRKKYLSVCVRACVWKSRHTDELSLSDVDSCLLFTFFITIFLCIPLEHDSLKLIGVGTRRSVLPANDIFTHTHTYHLLANQVKTWKQVKRWNAKGEWGLKGLLPLPLKNNNKNYKLS